MAGNVPSQLVELLKLIRLLRSRRSLVRRLGISGARGRCRYIVVAQWAYVLCSLLWDLAQAGYGLSLPHAVVAVFAVKVVLEG